MSKKVLLVRRSGDKGIIDTIEVGDDFGKWDDEGVRDHLKDWLKRYHWTAITDVSFEKNDHCSYAFVDVAFA